MQDTTEKIALFDMDGTLVDYDGQIRRDLEALRSTWEPPLPTDIYHGDGSSIDQDLEVLERRRHVITSQHGWWENLEKFQLGWDILSMCQRIGFTIVILTKGPRRKQHAWAEKVTWFNKHLAGIADGITITQDKGLVYGTMLVDDFPPYIERWLKWRPRGLVVMPAHNHNKDYVHPNVIRYDGTIKSWAEVDKRVKEAYSR